MNMRSADLLPALQELPGSDSDHRTFRDVITDLVTTDRAMYGAEFTSAASFGMWAIFDDINVDDKITAAYEAQYPRLAADHSLHEQWQEMIERGEVSMDKFIDGLKGKVAEFDTAEILEQNGFTGVTIAADPTHQVWDISAVDADGEAVFFQVKSYVEDNAYVVENLMSENPDIYYAVSTEVYDKIAESSPELIEQLIDIGSTNALEGSTSEGLNLLSDNMGIDIPDGIGEIIPYAGAIIVGARLVHTVIKTEKEFKAADRTTKNKIQVVQSLTVMSKFGVSAVLSTAGGVGGAAIGSIIPGPGNLIGGIVGAVGGAGMGMYLNRHLQPHMLNLALNITGLTNDDLFYYKNKLRIDAVALGFQTTARELAAVPA